MADIRLVYLLGNDSIFLTGACTCSSIEIDGLDNLFLVPSDSFVHGQSPVGDNMERLDAVLHTGRLVDHSIEMTLYMVSLKL